MSNKTKHVTVNKAYGRARLMVELSPLFNIRLNDERVTIAETDKDFLASHASQMDMFLLNAGYYDVVSVDDHDPSFYPHYDRGDDPFDDFVPDIIGFKHDIVNILNDSSVDGQKAQNVIGNLNRHLYSEEDQKQILFRKAQYLTVTLSSVFDMDDSDNGDPAHIAIAGANPDTIPDLFNGYQDMLIDLGFRAFSGFPEKDSLMSYLEGYINSGVYYDDGFTFGESVLRAYDQNIKQIDWFSHVAD